MVARAAAVREERRQVAHLLPEHTQAVPVAVLERIAVVVPLAVVRVVLVATVKMGEWVDPGQRLTALVAAEPMVVLLQRAEHRQVQILQVLVELLRTERRAERASIPVIRELRATQEVMDPVVAVAVPVRVAV